MPFGFFKNRDSKPSVVSSGTIQASSFLDPQDRIPAILSRLIYSKLPDTIGAFRRVASTYRIGVYLNDSDKTMIIVIRGTGPGLKGFFQDLRDDLIIAGLKRMDSCDLEAVNEAVPYIEEAIKTGYRIVVAGHSLGGSSALCIANRYPQIRAVSFNGGAPPTKPVLRGPGPGRATHYHIEGDRISSHISPAAAKVVRVRMEGINWGNPLAAHSADRFVDSRPFSIVTRDQEQTSWWRSAFWPPKHFFLSTLILANPIPI